MVASHEGKRLNLALLYSCATDNGIFRMLATKCDAILHRVPHTVRVHSPMTLLYMLAPSWGGNLHVHSSTNGNFKLTLFVWRGGLRIEQYLPCIGVVDLQTV